MVEWARLALADGKRPMAAIVNLLYSAKAGRVMVIVVPGSAVVLISRVP